MGKNETSTCLKREFNSWKIWLLWWEGRGKAWCYYNGYGQGYANKLCNVRMGLITPMPFVKVHAYSVWARCFHHQSRRSWSFKFTEVLCPCIPCRVVKINSGNIALVAEYREPFYLRDRLNWFRGIWRKESGASGGHLKETLLFKFSPPQGKRVFQWQKFSTKCFSLKALFLFCFKELNFFNKNPERSKKKKPCRVDGTHFWDSCILRCSLLPFQREAVNDFPLVC